MEKTNDEHNLFSRVGIFRVELRFPLVQELNRRNIDYRLEEIDEHAIGLYTAAYSLSETCEILDEIKRKYKRIRL